MSLDKAIAHGKEKRNPYRCAKMFHSSHRNHGSCYWCYENRLHKFNKALEDALYRQREGTFQAAEELPGSF